MATRRVQFSENSINCFWWLFLFSVLSLLGFFNTSTSKGSAPYNITESIPNETSTVLRNATQIPSLNELNETFVNSSSLSISAKPLLSSIKPHNISATSTQRSKHSNQTITNVFYIKEMKHKLLYCYIPKNACSIFKALFRGIIDHKPPVFNNNIHPQMRKYKYRPNAQFVADKLLNDESWRSFVVLRDPLERLVSGFNEKCVHIHTPHWCEGSKTLNFRDFVGRVLYKLNNGKIFDINEHYRPQYTFCGLNEYFEYFDYVIYYQRSTVANDTLRFMKDVGIADYYYNWGQYHNQTMFVQKTGHSSKAKQTSFDDKISFYSKYYDKELAMKVISAFDTDYKMFKFPFPDWLSAI